MSITFDSFPYDDRSMDEQDWKLMFSWMRTDGILTTNATLSATGDLAPAPYTGMTIQIYPGLALIQGFYFTYTTTTTNYTIVISDNTDPDPRIDVVVLRLDLTANSTVIAVLEGTPAPVPVAPALTQNNLIWEIALAEIDVASGETIISAGEITDLRVASVQGDTGSSAVTLASVGAGATLVADGTGPSLSVKGLVAGSNITLTPSGTDITIGAASNDDVCMVTRTATQSITAASSAAIAWDSELYDPNSMHDNVTNNSRITIINAGIYFISINITCTPAVCTFAFLKNGATNLISTVYGAYVNPTRIVQLAAADYIEVIATNTHASDAGVIDFTSGEKPLFQVVKLAEV